MAPGFNPGKFGRLLLQDLGYFLFELIKIEVFDQITISQCQTWLFSITGEIVQDQDGQIWILFFNCSGAKSTDSLAALLAHKIFLSGVRRVIISDVASRMVAFSHSTFLISPLFAGGHRAFLRLL